jgi:phosphate transport system substrate-binding protein
MAWLQNRAGEYIKPSLRSGQAALESAPLSDDNLRGWVPDPEGRASYPIVTYTWLIVPKKPGNARIAAALKDVMKYALTEGQKDCAEFGYIPLPESTRRAVLKAVETITP